MSLVEISIQEREYGIKFKDACKEKDVDLCLNLLKEQPGLVWYRCELTGQVPLHWACELGSDKLVRALFDNRHPWNLLDNEGRSCGELAEMNGFTTTYQLVVEEGVRAELILGAIAEAQKLAESQEKHENENENEKEEDDVNEKIIPNKEYLELPLKYSEDKLLDFENNGVMMGWEKPLMELHAKIIAPKSNLHLLNIGFGLGLIDIELQKMEPASHTIVEAHPDVYKHMLALGWDKKPNVRILFGRWQDQIDQISDRAYDGIFFDTFGEFYDDLNQFHEILPNILDQQGTYSFFNGLGGDVKLFNDVYCTIAQLHLADLGLSTEYRSIDMDPDSAKVWDGVKRRYWQLKTYHLPTCKFMM